MGSISNNNWYNLNSTRKYPLDDGCTGITDDGRVFPATIIEDINIRFVRDLGVIGMISSVKISENLVSLTVMSAIHPIIPSLYDPSPSTASGYFKPLCFIALPKPIVTGTPYPLTAFAPGVEGWVVFGDGVRKNFEAKFSLPIQSALNPKNCRYYRESPVLSLGKELSITKLKGLVRLVAGANITISKDVKTIDGVERTVISFSLKQKNGENVLSTYKGPDAGRPESKTCSQDSIEFINSVEPDCDGNIDILFQPPFRTAFYEDAAGGMAVDYPIGLIDACTAKDRLPDAQGALPTENEDLCPSSSSSLSISP